MPGPIPIPQILLGLGLVFGAYKLGSWAFGSKINVPDVSVKKPYDVGYAAGYSDGKVKVAKSLNFGVVNFPKNSKDATDAQTGYNAGYAAGYAAATGGGGGTVTPPPTTEPEGTFDEGFVIGNKDGAAAFEQAVDDYSTAEVITGEVPASYWASHKKNYDSTKSHTWQVGYDEGYQKGIVGKSSVGTVMGIPVTTRRLGRRIAYR